MQQFKRTDPLHAADVIVATSKGLFKLHQNKFLNGLICIVALFLVLHLFPLHFHTIFFEYPLEYRENSDLARAYLISIGKNIFSYESFPWSNSQYGVLYPWLGSKLLGFTGIHFYPLRLITALSILPILGLFLWQGVKEELSPLHLFLVCAIVYVSCLIHVGNLQAMPNTLGWAFFSLSVLVPPLLKFSKLSLISSCVFAGLGFFAKIYFGIGAFYVLLYLFVNKRWGSFWFMLTPILAAAALSALTIVYYLPAFYETNISLNNQLASWQPDYIWTQSRYFIRVFFGLIALLALCNWLSPQSKIISLSNPYVFGLVLSSIALLKLGGAAGQFFLYFQQLLLPFLAALSIQIIKDSKKKHFISLLLLLNLLTLHNEAMKHNDLENIARSFREIENKTAVLDPNAELFYTPPTSYFAVRQKKIPNDSGQTSVLLFTKGKLGAKYQAQFDLLSTNILARKYQQVFTNEEMHPLGMDSLDLLIHNCYRRSKMFDIVMYAQKYKTEMWVPNGQCNGNGT